MAAKHGPKCMCKGCKNQADGFRGLCRSCYFSICRLVRNGRESWAALEKGGVVLPRKSNKTGHFKSAIGRQLAGK